MQTDNPSVKSRPLISADRVRGTLVFDQGGQKLGHIEDVMLDKVSGKVAYAIMSHGGFLGAGERYHPLPWSILSYDTTLNGYATSLAKDQLEDAPTLDRPQIDNQDDTGWTEAVHTHYGLPGPFI